MILLSHLIVVIIPEMGEVQQSHFDSLAQTGSSGVEVASGKGLDLFLFILMNGDLVFRFHTEFV